MSATHVVSSQDGTVSTSDKVRRTLVLTGCAPGDDGVGAILQRQIFEEIPRELLHVVTISSRENVETDSSSDWVDTSLTRKFEHAWRPVNGLGGNITSYLAHIGISLRHLKRLAAECISAGKQHQAEAMVAVFDSPTPIFIAEKVARRLDVPLYCFVMDGPALHAFDYGYRGAVRKRFMNAFDSAMNCATRIATAGETMQSTYQQKYGKPTTILRQGVQYKPGTMPELSHDGPVRIGFSGSLTAREAFYSLISELDDRKWILANRPVIIRLAGPHVRLSPSGAQHIEYFGWRPVPDMMQLMGECDFLYMPQPFSGHLTEFAELSFPNKLCTYVPVRRPIMLHTPPNASLPSFFDRYPCGPRSTELSATSLLDQTEEAILDRNVYATFQQTVESAFREELNYDALKNGVFEFIGSTGNVSPK